MVVQYILQGGQIAAAPLWSRTGKIVLDFHICQWRWRQHCTGFK